ncbi:MAG TPA: glycosyltransferase family 2 protein [Gammaproteobacteria bacterium]|nr:glycosyltransferase family 2 protein [Gammaproteobacteria bacterium]
MDLTVVIPVFNEAEGIVALLGEIPVRLDGLLDYEIVVVDDGSTDAMPAVLQECRARQPRLRVLRHQVRSGQSAALASGVSAARAPWIATLDGDGQNDPADIMKLYRAMEQSPDRITLLAGHRRVRRDTWLRRISSRVANTVRAALLSDNTPDTGCGLKLFPRALFLALPQFDHMHRFLPALVYRQGGEVLSIEVSHRERRSGYSKYGVMNRLWVGIVDLLGVWWLIRRRMQPAVTEIK